MSVTAEPRRASGWIPNAPFRARAEQLLAQGYTLSELCVRGGLVDRRGRPQTTSLERALGMKPEAPTIRKGRRYGGTSIRRTVGPDMVGKLCRALDMDPHEVEPPAELPRLPDVWCPTCDEISFVAPDGRCPWCETELGEGTA